MNITNKKIFSNKALLPDGWANNILLEIDRAGLISSVTKNCDKSKISFDLNEDMMIPAIVSKELWLDFQKNKAQEAMIAFGLGEI